MRHTQDVSASTWLTTRYDHDGAMVWASGVPRWSTRHPIDPPAPRERPVDPHPFFVPVVPAFGCEQFTPWCFCCHQPFPDECPWYCPVCQMTGFDHFPQMQLDADELLELHASEWREHHRDNGRLTGGRGVGTREWTVARIRGKRLGFSFRKPRSGPPWPSHHRGHR
jgi:hypothetical protein